MKDLLSIYLRDHAALITAELELIERCWKSNSKCNTPLGEEITKFLTGLETEVQQQRSAVRTLLRCRNESPDMVKEIAGWAAEKIGRLKFNGQWSGYSELSRVIELEGLILAAQSRKLLWHAVGGCAPENSATMAEQAAQHIDRLSELHRQANQQAFKCPPLET